MQKRALKISRNVEYALRAMIYLASIPPQTVVSFREIARSMQAPEEFLAKILKILATKGLVRSIRGSRGGYLLGKPASEISFLEVIEAVKGPIVMNICLEGNDSCKLNPSCTMARIWKQGQEKMLEVYRSAKLDQLAMESVFAPGDSKLVGNSRPNS